MQIEISVQRQPSPEDAPYIQKFSYEGDGQLSVADWLQEINQTEVKSDRIAWECGCMEKKCGACAMRINGIPMLACSIFLKKAARHGKILLEPLSKFPLVKDLVVDRQIMFDALKEMKIWMQEKDWTGVAWDAKLQYRAGQCLQCGCCLEVCPNFPADKGFAGAAAMVKAYKAIEQSGQSSHKAEMQEEYRKHFFSYCGQALSCQTVCPMHLPLDEIQARVNGHK